MNMPADFWRKKALCLSIKGWSARPQVASLKGILDELGQVLNYVHYPSTQTTFVKIVMHDQKFSLARISARIPGIRVEKVPNQTIKAALADKGTPDLTIYLSKKAYFSETEVAGCLAKFGLIRAIEHFYSPASQKWISRVTFYESYSVRSLLEEQAPIGSAGKAFGHFQITPLLVRPSQAIDPPKVLVNAKDQQILKKIREPTPKDQVAKPGLKDRIRLSVRRCRSIDVPSGATASIPMRPVFKRSEDSLMSSLLIAHSQAAESLQRAAKMGSRTRLRSLDRKYFTDTSYNGPDLKIAFQHSLASLGSNSYPMNEIAFLQLSSGKIERCPSELPPAKIIYDTGLQNKSRDSYLSEEEASAGVTVIEVHGFSRYLHAESGVISFQPDRPEDKVPHTHYTISTDLAAQNELDASLLSTTPLCEETRAAFEWQRPGQSTPNICFFSFPPQY